MASRAAHCGSLATAVVAICAGVATLLWAGHQLRLEMQQDTQRAMQMLAGGRNVGANRLQVPMLRRASFPKVAQQQRSMAAAADQALGALDLSRLKFKGRNVILSFVGMMPSSNHDINNYIVFGVRQKLVAAGADNVLVSYPSTTYQLGQSQAEAGVVSELDNVLALVRDTQLSAGAVKGADPVFLKIKQAGVDTYDRSAFTPAFYIRAFVVSMLALLGVAGAAQWLEPVDLDFLFRQSKPAEFQGRLSGVLVPSRVCRWAVAGGPGQWQRRHCGGRASGG
ncbi:MAG: hypothetical protein EBT14_09105 [Betaproteobacteria bacterium]|nr:hypothetical protein [Betaproteobacteria bacterium]